MSPEPTFLESFWPWWDMWGPFILAAVIVIPPCAWFFFWLLRKYPRFFYHDEGKKD